MANIYTSLATLSPGKKDLKVKIRVANMWTVPDKYRPNVVTFMNLLLVDDQVY